MFATTEGRTQISDLNSDAFQIVIAHPLPVPRRRWTAKRIRSLSIGIEDTGPIQITYFLTDLAIEIHHEKDPLSNDVGRYFEIRQRAILFREWSR